MKSLFAIVALLLGFVKRWFQRKDNPALQYETAKQTNAQVVVSGDADAINRKLSRGLPIDPEAGGD